MEPVWRRSSFCGGGGNNCVEVAPLGPRIGVRDSKRPEPVVSIAPAAFTAFLGHLRARP
ncbi:DUF397 domain-containing protein [Streptomyces sp. NRRL S-87]|uniref:DUF397 domain-containing protein n=1 Tax=Streptomyces sp. NRRL S-87 TaxID=1463920 RepID=UPI00099C91BB|nr:DUF397 domain-containing protein [Streptomyces sp. NRRL S-87]